MISIAIAIRTTPRTARGAVVARAVVVPLGVGSRGFVGIGVVAVLVWHVGQCREGWLEILYGSIWFYLVLFGPDWLYLVLEGVEGGRNKDGGLYRWGSR